MRRRCDGQTSSMVEQLRRRELQRFGIRRVRSTGNNRIDVRDDDPSKGVEMNMKRQLIHTLQCQQQDIFMSHGDEYDHSIPPFLVAFSEKKMHGNLLAVADEEGYVSYYTTHERTPPLPEHHQIIDHKIPIAKFAAHRNAIFDLIWCHGDEQIATASGDQQVSIWDVETSTQISTFQGHSMSVKCVRQMPSDPYVFASGSRDGNVYFWDTRYPQTNQSSTIQTFRPVEACMRCHDFESAPSSGDKRKRRRTSIPNAQRSVTCVEFTGDGNQLISAGAVDGMVKFWDMRTLSDNPTSLTQVRSFGCLNPNGRRYGISSLTLDHTKSKLLVSAASNDIFLYDLVRSSDEPISKYYGHKNSSFYVKSGFSPESDYIVSGSVDQNVYIWDVNSSGTPAIVLQGHEGEVSSVSWCKSDFTKIASCSDDGTIRVWRMEKNNTNKKHDTYTCGKGCGNGHCDVYRGTPPPPTIPDNHGISPASASRPAAIQQQPLTLHHFWK